jgi:hypothetical protein
VEEAGVALGDVGAAAAVAVAAAAAEEEEEEEVATPLRVRDNESASSCDERAEDAGRDIAAEGKEEGGERKGREGAECL